MSSLDCKLSDLHKSRNDLRATIGKIDVDLRAIKAMPKQSKEDKELQSKKHRLALFNRNRALTHLQEVNLEIRRVGIKMQEQQGFIAKIRKLFKGE